MVNYCLDSARDSTREHRPYFIFISENQECLPEMSSLGLNVLSAEDAHDLIKKGLNAKNYTNEEVEELAKTLHYFPLDLLSAIAFINRQNELLQEGFKIEHYLNYIRDF